MLYPPGSQGCHVMARRGRHSQVGVLVALVELNARLSGHALDAQAD